MFWLLSTILPKLLPAAAPLSCNIMCCVIIWITRSSFIWQGAVCRCAAGCGGNLGPTIARARVTQSRADTRRVLIPRANHSLAYDGWVICISFLFWQGFGLMSICSGWAGSHQIHLVLPSSANVSESQIFPLSARQPLASSLARDAGEKTRFPDKEPQYATSVCSVLHLWHRGATLVYAISMLFIIIIHIRI